MRILRLGASAPDHMLITDNPTGHLHLLEGDIVNLIAVPLQPRESFARFARSAATSELKPTIIFTYPQAHEADDWSIAQQVERTQLGMSRMYDGLTNKDEIIETVSRVVKDFCNFTHTEELAVRQTGLLGPHTRDMLPHIDVKAERRCLLDLSGLGMIAYDQTGLSVSARKEIAAYTNTVASITELKPDLQAELAERAVHVPGPVALFFNGMWSGNPLLHAAVPPEMMPAEQKDIGFRPCWRIDSYYC